MTTEAAVPIESTGPQVDRAAQILAGAFYDDPLWAWAFPDPQRRREQHLALWRMFVEGAARHSWVWLNGSGTSAAVWLPPGCSELTPEQESRFEDVVGELAGPSADRVLAAFTALEEAHPHGTPHYYLSLLGTDPEHRGHGHGLALLAETLRRIDQARGAAYLEASNLVNIPLYARYGFEPLRSVVMPGGGPEVVTMWRAAVGSP